MKRWNTVATWLGSSGLCFVLFVSGSGSSAEPPAPAPAAPAADDPNDDSSESLGFLTAAAANRGPRKAFQDPAAGASYFLRAIEKKDLNKASQATALRAATESKNKKLFQSILAQKLPQEDLDDLAAKLAGFKIAGLNQGNAPAIAEVNVTKPDRNAVLRRTLTMREEKAGWKLLDIGDESRLEKPTLPP